MPAPRALPSPRAGTAPHLILRAVAATMLVVEIAIRAYLAPAHLEEMPYIGVSFVISAVLLLVVLIANLVTPRWAIAWQFGALICLGMAVLFVISRTAGLPDYQEGWTADSNLGLVSLAADLVYLACVPRRPASLA
jgi:hypothetical protein